MDWTSMKYRIKVFIMTTKKNATLGKQAKRIEAQAKIMIEHDKAY